MRKSEIHWSALLAVGASTLALSSVARAQTTPAQPTEQAATLDDVVVTAQRREQSLQDVPITVSSINAEGLANARVTEINDIGKLVPGLRSSGDTGTSTPILRGVGNLTLSPGNDSAVSFYVDGVYIPTTLTGLLSINQATRVEVLKGPQGTLFGRNASAGLIQITTRGASDVLEVEGEVGYANYDTASFAGFIAGPLNDRFGASLSVAGRSQGDGWGVNVFDGSDVRKIDSDVSARGGFYFDFADDTKFTLRADYQRTKATGTWALGVDPTPQNTAFGPVSNGDSVWNVNNDVVPVSLGESWGVSATLRHDFSFATLTSITAYRDHSLAVPRLDLDGTPIAALQLDNLQTATQFTQELQLTSSSDGPLSWTAGAYYFDGEDGSDSSQIIGPLLQAGFGNVAISASQGRQSTRSISAYAQADYSFTTRTTLTVGARYTEEERKLNAPSLLTFSNGSTFTLPVVNDNVKANVPTWRVALLQELTDDINVYGSVSKGFKSGGFNLANPNNPPFDPEELVAYEVGVRSTLAGGRLRLNSSAFFYKYDNLQISGFDAAAGGIQQVYNAASAEIYGLDIDFFARLSDAFTLSGGLEYLHAEYSDFPNAVIAKASPLGGYTIVSGNATGNTMAQSPEFSGSLIATYSFDTEPGLITASADANYNSGFYYQPDNNLKQDAYTLLGASVRFEPRNQPFYVQVYGKNLGEEAVRALNIQTPFGAVAQFNAPRTYGMVLGFKF